MVRVFCVPCLAASRLHKTCPGLRVYRHCEAWRPAAAEQFDVKRDNCKITSLEELGDDGDPTCRRNLSVQLSLQLCELQDLQIPEVQKALLQDH